MDHIETLRQSVTEFAKTLDLPPFVHRLNDLLNQRAWEQAAIEEKKATQKIADMWEIVQTIGTIRSTRWNEHYACYQCPFCLGDEDNHERDHIRHDPNCIIMKARAQIKTPKQGA